LEIFEIDYAKGSGIDTTVEVLTEAAVVVGLLKQQSWKEQHQVQIGHSVIISIPLIITWRYQYQLSFPRIITWRNSSVSRVSSRGVIC
jgi:hypothetical protein